ncbi:MAG: hypothetical protein U0Q18_25870 [Bryobacteraceae bacterium]
MYHSDGTQTSFPDTAAGLQSAVSTSRAADIVECAPQSSGVVYDFTGAQFFLAVASGVTLRSSDYQSLPGGRVCAADTAQCASDAPHMCKIVNNNLASYHLAALQDGTQGFTLDGVEIAASSKCLYCALLATSNSTSRSQDTTQNITFTRLWLHGYFGLPGPEKCLAVWGGVNVTIRNSLLSECGKANGQDGQGIGILSGSGIHISNNAIEAETQNVMIGGGQSTVVGEPPQSITISYNWLFKDLWWKQTYQPYDPSGQCLYWAGNSHGELWQNTLTGGQFQCTSRGNWGTFTSPTGAALDPAVYTDNKNLIEVKPATDPGGPTGGSVSIYGNIGENTYCAQQGSPIITNASPPPVAPVQGTYIGYNLWRNHGQFYSAGNYPQYATGTTVEHNICDSCAEPLRCPGPGTATIKYIAQGGVYRHNSFPNASNALQLVYYNESATPGVNATVMDNIGNYGYRFLNGSGGHTCAWVFGAGGPDAGGILAYNIVPLNAASIQTALGDLNQYNSGAPDCYNNQFPAWSSGVYVNEKGGDYHVQAQYKGTASDGTDPGANVDAVMRMTSGVRSGVLVRRRSVRVVTDNSARSGPARFP